MKKIEFKKALNHKSIFWGYLVMAVIAGIAISCTKGEGQKAFKAVKEGQVLSVADIQSDPFAYKGAITVTGVVAGKAEGDTKVFMMVDTTEAKVCKQTGCAKFYLPVRFEKELPKEWDEVNVTGRFADGKFLFMADKVDVLRHLTF